MMYFICLPEMFYYSRLKRPMIVVYESGKNIVGLLWESLVYDSEGCLMKNEFLIHNPEQTFLLFLYAEKKI